MAKSKVPGIGKSKGIQRNFPAYAAGKYRVRIAEAAEEERSNEKGSFTMYRFRLEIINGPGQPDGRDVTGKPIFGQITVLNEDHVSYEKSKDIGIDQLRSYLDATDIPIKADSFDFEASKDKIVWVTLKVKPGDPDAPEDSRQARESNEIVDWKADDDDEE